jgi:hypothetical protein
MTTMPPPPLPNATDLPRDLRLAASRGQPLVLLVTFAGCPYCEVVRNSYLRPLQAEGLVPVRQVQLRGGARLVAPDGRPATEQQLARRLGATMAPAVFFLGEGGASLAAPLIGFSEAFYGAYLDEALEQARLKLRKG